VINDTSQAVVKTLFLHTVLNIRTSFVMK